MPSIPFDAAHEASPRVTVCELPEVEAWPTTQAGDGDAEAMLRADTEIRVAQAADGIAAPGAGEDCPAPVQVVPAGLWRPKAIAAALRAEGMGSLKQMEAVTAFMFGFRHWRELARAATKGRADPPDEQCGAEEVRRRRAYQASVLASYTYMGPVAAAIAVDALRPTAKAGRPALDAGAVARMQAASRDHADAKIEEEPDSGWGSRERVGATGVARGVANAVGRVLARAGTAPDANPLDMIDALRRVTPIQPGVWLPTLEGFFGWSFAEVDEDAERDGDQIAVAVGQERRLPVFMSAATYVPGSLEDAPVARMQARIAEKHPAGAVLVFNDPVVWLPGHGPAGLLYGGLLWSDNGWSDFVLRPDGGLDDALGQRGHDLAHPDARTAAAFGFPDALALLYHLATALEGLDLEEAEVEYLRCANGWLLPLVRPK